MGLDLTHGPSRRADDTRAPEVHPEIDYGADESDGDTGGWDFSRRKKIYIFSHMRYACCVLTNELERSVFVDFTIYVRLE
jgi:hypothetical protein